MRRITSSQSMSVKRNIIANYLGQGWAALMGIAFVPLYVRALGVESYGLIGVFTVLQAWMTLLDLGLTPTLNREMARLKAGAHTAESIRDLLRSLEIIYAGLAVLMIAIVWFCAPWLASNWLQAVTLPAETVIKAIKIMGFVLATRWLEQVYRGVLQGVQDQVWLNICQGVLATIRWGGAYLVLAYVSPTITNFFVWQGGISIFAAAILVHRTYCLLPHTSRTAKFSLEALVEVRSFASGMFLSAILTFALTQADKLVISTLLPLEQLGYYMLASTAVGGLSQLITPMTTAVYPKLTELAAKNDSLVLKYTYQQSCEWMAAVIIPPSLLLSIFAYPTLLLWTGDSRLATEVAPVMALLALGTLCNGLMNMPYMLQLAFGWTSLSVRVNFVAVAIMVPAIVWVVPRFGTVGAASIWFILNFCYVVIVAHLIYRRLLPSEKWVWYRRAVALPMLGGGVAAGSVYWLVPMPTSRGDAGIYVAVALIVMFCIVVATLPSVKRTLMQSVKVIWNTKCA